MRRSSITLGWAIVAAASFAGCNAILGVERLEPFPEGSGAAAGSGGDATGGEATYPRGRLTVIRFCRTGGCRTRGALAGARRSFLGPIFGARVESISRTLHSEPRLARNVAFEGALLLEAPVRSR